MNISSLSGLVGIGVALLALVPLVLGGVFVILIVANRAEPDPTGRRPAIVYMLGTSFVTLFVTLFATFIAVAELSSLIGTRSGSGESIHPVGDEVARAVVISLLVAAVAGGMLFVHLRGALRQDREGNVVVAGPVGPVGRVWQSYNAAVSFVCVFIVIAASVVAIYQLFRIIGPGVFSPRSGNRVAGVRALLPNVYLAGAAVAILLGHQRVVGPLRDIGIVGPLGSRDQALGD